jgi:2,3-bisphosphoglycerate-independent phosphoglycerate mutase
MPDRQKCVLIIVDGLGDLPIPGLVGQTPLEAAHTPVLNRLAAAGRCGLVDPLAPGKIPNTHSGCGLLLGLVPDQVKRMKRGPVEAAGAGRALKPGEIAVRANFASVMVRGDELLVTDRRAGRISSGTGELAAALQDVDLGDGIRATLIPTDQHRAALVMSGPGLNPAVTDTDPGDVPLPVKLNSCMAKGKGAELTAEKINLFISMAFSRLNGHPVNEMRRSMGELAANAVITRGAGAWFSLDNIFERRGMRVSVVAGCNTVTGLGKMLGFDTIKDSRFTADLDTDLPAKMDAAIKALDTHEMIYVHIKAPDICAHDLKPLAKRDFIERIDAAMQRLEQAGCMIALTADHTTDSNTGFHAADPVPALIYEPKIRYGLEPVNFGESACRSGRMLRQSSRHFLQEVVRSMGW